MPSSSSTALFTAALALTACGPTEPPPPTFAPGSVTPAVEDPPLVIGPAVLAGQARGHNLLLVTLDTTRADRLGCYGSREASTRMLDELATQGVLMERVLTVTPMTAPSHTSILSGLYPLDHGVHENGIFQVHEDTPLLATTLKEAGYSTAAVVSSVVLSRGYGFERGFDHYDDRMDFDGGKGTGEVERRAEQSVDAALAWLGTAPPEPWFLWLHLYDAHQPYVPPAPFDKLRMHPYDAEVANMDAHVGRLLRELDRRQWADRTVVAVTSDHGDGLGDHGEESHGLFVYDSTMRVPLILRHPALRAGLRVGGQVSVVDLLPTVLELLGVDDPVPRSGRSFLGVLSDESPEVWHWPYLETQATWYSYGVAPLEGILDSRYKYVHAPRPELYDWTEDPGETVNLAETQPEVMDRMIDLLVRARDGREPLGQTPNRSLSPEEAERLEALGYVQGAAGSSPDVDPKDYLKILQWHMRAGQAAAAGRYAEAETILLQIMEGYPSDPALHTHLGETYLSMNRPEDAIASFEQALSLRPDYWTAALLLGNVYYEKGEWETAADAYEHVLEYAPNAIETRFKAGRAALRSEQVPRARRFVEPLQDEDLNEKQRAELEGLRKTIESKEGTGG